MADYDTGGEPGEAINKGPNGSGQYRNSNNSMETSGDTEETEATSMTGEVMAAMGNQPRIVTGSERQMTPGEMAGGNA